MTKAGPVISTGPAIASSREGSSLGVRVGGIEGGRSISISPAEARITGLFGPAIKSHNIGFGVPNPRGERSIRALSPLINPLPERGELGRAKLKNPVISRDPGQQRVVFGTIRFSESAPKVVSIAERVKPNLIQFPSVKVVAPERVRVSKVSYAEPVKVNPEIRYIPGRIERVFARSFRANFARLTGSKAQTRIVAGVENSTALRTQVQTQAGSVSETVAKTAVEVAPKPKVESGRQSPNRTRISLENARQVRTQKEEELRRRYIGRDIEANSRRLAVLIKAHAELMATAEVVEGKALANASFIGTAESLKSELLLQKGHRNREDGSQTGIEERLRVMHDVSRADLERLVKDNSAVKAINRPPAELATRDEVTKVLTPRKQLLAESEPVVLEEITEKITRVTEKPEVGLPVISVQPAQISEAARIEDAETGEPVLNNIIAFQKNLLDIWVHNDDVLKRKELIA